MPALAGVLAMLLVSACTTSDGYRRQAAYTQESACERDGGYMVYEVTGSRLPRRQVRQAECSTHHDQQKRIARAGL